MRKYKKMDIFGANIDLLSQGDVIEWANSNIDAEKSFEFVVTPNVDHIVRLNNESAFCSVYRSADITVCDSRIINLMARVAYGVDLPLVTGSDLTARLFESHLKYRKVAIIGGSDSVVEKLQEKYVIGETCHYNPPMGFYRMPEELNKCVDFIRATSPEIVFLCVGSPQQELVARKIRDSGDINGVGFCVGASLLFLVGEERRAPKWVQSFSLEWLYRLINNPKRLLKRYLIDDIVIVKIFIMQCFRRVNLWFSNVNR